MTTDFEFMTYPEAASRLGIAQASVKRQATRHKWPKRKGNDGRVAVGIPITRLTDDSRPDSRHNDPTIHDLQKLVAILEVKLTAERQMKETAIQDRDAWKEQAQRLARPWWKRLAG
ncbi:hypothetical protein RAM19_00035 (plasmid) [Bartonella apihabitans]|nr:hypothetical protein [Bartonella apihabitans]WLT07733.1 hypothetical protein RAM19_00035 [Bartonella apihabitans]